MRGQPRVCVLEREREPAGQQPSYAIGAPAADGEKQRHVLGGDGCHRRSGTDGDAALHHGESVPLQRGAKPFLGEAAVIVWGGVSTLHEWDIDQHAAAGGEDAMDLRQRRLRVLDVFEHGLRDAAGERCVGERQRLGEADDVDRRIRGEIEIDDVRAVRLLAGAHVQEQRVSREGRGESLGHAPGRKLLGRVAGAGEASPRPAGSGGSRPSGVSTGTPST